MTNFFFHNSYNIQLGYVPQKVQCEFEVDSYSRYTACVLNSVVDGCSGDSCASSQHLVWQE